MWGADIILSLGKVGGKKVLIETIICLPTAQLEFPAQTGIKPTKIRSCFPEAILRIFLISVGMKCAQNKLEPDVVIFEIASIFGSFEAAIFH